MRRLRFADNRLARSCRGLAAGVLVIVTLALAGCAEDSQTQSSYSITVTASTFPKPLPFSGTYQFKTGGQSTTRDLSGAGSFNASFVADEIVYVRVIATSRQGLYGLRILRDGDLIFESSAVPATQPILYTLE